MIDFLSHVIYLGSDEPGTSACSNVKERVKFTCINKGYRSVKVAASRVDDGVCDCDDGSDEIPGKCPNNALIAAIKERELLNRINSTYIQGSEILRQLELQVKTELQRRAELFEQYKTQSDNFKRNREELQIHYDTLVKSLNDELSQLKNDALRVVKSALNFDTLTFIDISQFLKAILNIHKFDGDQLDSIVSNEVRAAGDSNEEEFVHRSFDDEHEDSYHEDIIGADIAESNHITAADDEIVSDDLKSCDLFNLTLDKRFKSLCESEYSSSQEKLIDFILERLFAELTSFKEVELLMGYYLKNRRFDGSEEFVYQILSNIDGSDNVVGSNNVCFSEFGQLGEENANICQLQSILNDSYTILRKSAPDFDLEHPLYVESLAIHANIEQLDSDIKSADENLDVSQRAIDDLQFPYFAHLAYQDAVVSIKDGAYTYKVQVLDKITQQEDGRGEVLLGKSDSISLENGEIVWEYKDGDHCWNHGNRRAEVRVTCGVENVLLSVREPSTCFYLLQMESPVACTIQYAEMQGIL